MSATTPENLSPPGASMLNRRDFLRHSGSAFGGMALAGLLANEGLLASPIRPEIETAHPYAPRKTHFPARAKQVLVIYCTGAVSHVDTFDYKPELIKRHDTPLPGVGKTFQGENGNLIRPIREFKPRGQCGKMTSDLLPHLGSLADDVVYLHSLTSKTNTHGPGETYMSTGFILEGFPSMGAWTTYALGTENEDLPAFVSIPDPRGNPQASINNWSNAFLPAQFQGTPFSASKKIRHLFPPEKFAGKADHEGRNLLKRINERHLERYPGDSELAARIAGYELAARMQMSIPEVTDLSNEPPSILKQYGADDTKNKNRAGFAQNCILARRLLEKGVRFVQLFNGSYAMGEGVGNWDGHKSIEAQYPGHAHILDQPAAALIRDLKSRGLLEDVLVVWCTEFGRMPTFQRGASGRDHNPFGFTAWLAGAGVNAPFTYGSTDAFGWKAEKDVLTLHDFHATILYLLGLDHERLSFYHNGIERRLTDVHGHVIADVIA